MKILVACEESQAVTKELRWFGHEAYSCDIIDQSGGHPEWHIMQDVLPLLNGRCTFTTTDGTIHKVEGKWDMIIAFPPCTFMTAASACRMYPKKGVLDPERYEKAQKAKIFFYAFLNADCDKIAIENPKPLKVVGLPPESQRIQPWQFARDIRDFFTKLTYLWLKGLPTLAPIRTEKPEGTLPFVNAGSKKANGESRDMTGRASSAIERSKTFPGIARAMAEQWAGLTEDVDDWML